MLQFIYGVKSEVSSFKLNNCLGIIRDYYIVYTLETPVHHQNLLEPQTAAFPHKSFFWASSSNFIFSSLPTCNPANDAKFKELRTLFSGEFDTVIFESGEAPKVIDAMNGIVLPPKHVTELDRLAFVVQEIDRCCSAIPAGALKYTPLH